MLTSLIISLVAATAWAATSTNSETRGAIVVCGTKSPTTFESTGNTTIFVPFGNPYFHPALDLLSDIWITGALGVDVQSVSCVAYRAFETVGRAFTPKKPLLELGLGGGMDTVVSLTCATSERIRNGSVNSDTSISGNLTSSPVSGSLTRLVNTTTSSPVDITSTSTSSMNDVSGTSGTGDDTTVNSTTKSYVSTVSDSTSTFLTTVPAPSATYPPRSTITSTKVSTRSSLPTLTATEYTGPTPSPTRTRFGLVAPSAGGAARETAWPILAVGALGLAVLV
jgi:hypothetical protein